MTSKSSLLDGLIMPPTNGPLSDHPLLFSSTFEMHIYRRERICCRLRID